MPLFGGQGGNGLSAGDEAVLCAASGSPGVTAFIVPGLSGLRGVACCLFAMAMMGASGESAGDEDLQYSSARELVRAGQYSAALNALESLRSDQPDHPQRPGIDTRIAVLHETRGADPAIAAFITVLDQRDDGAVDAAINGLRDLIIHAESSRLHDDALYLLAYLQLMDRFDYAAARAALTDLLERYPASSYRDSAHYLDAIALEQLGRTEQARITFEQLRDRHTSVSLPFGFRWPSGSVLSRYWYERADRRLAILDRQQAESTDLGALVRRPDGSSQVTVSSQGVDLPLVLVPAGLTRTTRWLADDPSGNVAPALGVYAGHVAGDTASWARVIIEEGAVRGVVYAHSKYFRLQPADLVGTLDYYQPRRQSQLPPATDGRALSDRLHSDTMMAPPVPDAASLERAQGLQTDVRRVPLSVVVDSQFDRYYAGNGMARALNSLNVADGLHRQHGLALSLVQARIIEATPDRSDPFDLGPVTLESSLRRFRDYRLAETNAYEDSALVYLFTGNPKTDVTLGLAWIGTACRSDGYDVGVTTPSTLGDLLLTHELGHSFGASHDSETDCRAQSHRIMWPEVSSRTGSEFTQCSGVAIVPSRDRACLLNGVDLTLDVQVTRNDFRFVVSHSDSTLVTDATLAIETSVPGALDWPSACRPQTPGSATCQLSDIGPGQRQVFNVQLDTVAADRQFAVSAYLDSALIGEVAPADNRRTLLFDGRGEFTDPDELIEPAASVAPSMGQASGGSGSAAGISVLFVLLVYLGRFTSVTVKRWHCRFSHPA